jgi:hypothetical protein
MHTANDDTSLCMFIYGPKKEMLLELWQTSVPGARTAYIPEEFYQQQRWL